MQLHGGGDPKNRNYIRIGAKPAYLPGKVGVSSTETILCRTPTLYRPACLKAVRFHVSHFDSWEKNPEIGFCCPKNLQLRN